MAFTIQKREKTLKVVYFYARRRQFMGSVFEVVWLQFMVQFTFTLFAAAAWFRYCRQSMMLVCGNWIPFISEVDCYCSDLNLSEQFNFISCAHSTTTDHFPLPVVPATSKPKRISLLLPRNNIDTEPHSKFRTASGSAELLKVARCSFGVRLANLRPDD